MAIELEHLSIGCVRKLASARSVSTTIHGGWAKRKKTDLISEIRSHLRGADLVGIPGDVNEGEAGDGGDREGVRANGAGFRGVSNRPSPRKLVRKSQFGLDNRDIAGEAEKIVLRSRGGLETEPLAKLGVRKECLNQLEEEDRCEINGGGRAIAGADYFPIGAGGRRFAQNSD